METLEPVGLAVPLARITSIQFGLPTTREFLASSVFENRQSIEKQQQLLDARLGLPAPGDSCTSCGATSLESCDGHFGHIVLPSAIFHPSHISKLCKLLQKLCLNCCRLKKRSNSKDKNIVEEDNKGDHFDDVKTIISDAEGYKLSQSSMRQKISPDIRSHSKPEASDKSSTRADKDGKSSKSADTIDPPTSLTVSLRNLQSNTTGATSVVKKEHFDMSGYVLISDDEEGASAGDAIIMTKPRRKVMKKQPCGQPSAVYPVIDVGSDDENFKQCENFTSGEEVKLSAVAESTKFLELNCGEKQFNRQGTNRNCKKRQLPTKKNATIGCKYCAKSNDGDAKYPAAQLKVVSKFIRNDESIESIQMEISQKVEEVPSDYWNFLGNHFKSPAEEKSRARSLLPVEALQILRKIPENIIKKLGMDDVVARPEAFILECIPVPPNCIRLSENMVHNTCSASRVGADTETQILRSILKKIASIKGARAGQATYRASLIEFEQLQYLFSQYLRVKGAPKVAGNSEPKVLRYHFLSSKTSGSKWLNQLRGTVLGKSSNFSARNIITGDPCIEIDEISVPMELSNNITIPEKVTPLNKEILQDYVDKAPLGFPSSGPLIIEQGGRAFDISMAKNRRVLEIGDSVHRRLCNGDRVFANRPPTLNKHALICLKVRLQTNNSFAINPILCAPYEADFDGDALHVFIPQSIESRSETCELMTVENQFVCSQGGQAIVSLAQDALLAAYMLTMGHTFFTKSQICQMLMWQSPSFGKRFPLPAILKSPAGPLWTGKQVFSMTLPVGLNYSSPDSSGVLIQDGDILRNNGGSQWLKNFPDSLVSAISRHKGSAEALEHLSLAAKFSQEWIFLQGFSLGLLDFCGGENAEVRTSMVKEEIQEAKYYIDKQWELINMMKKEIEPTSSKNFLNLVITSLKESFLKIEQRMLDLMGPKNSLSAILKAGSKGSAAKLRQQVCCLGIQLHRGKHFINLNQARQVPMTPSSHGVSAVIPGLIETSYLEGLSPIEFYFCTIPSREASVKQGIDIRQPGMLFKNLMLFLRDITSSYDGTVRYNYNKQLIQFKYGGSKARGHLQLLKTKHGLHQVYKVEERERLRWRDSYMAGEAVGVLAATAIVQPAYQMLLDPPQLTDARGGSPFEILQDSLLNRCSSYLKDIDRTVILRVKQYRGKSVHWKEWNALKVQDHLRKITLETLSQSIVIEFQEKHNSGECIETNLKESPWLCHIQLKEDALKHFEITTDDIVRSLKEALNDKSNACKWDPSIKPFFFCRKSCNVCVSSNMEVNGPCLHVIYGYNEECFVHGGDHRRLLELLESIRDRGLPFLMSMTIKGKAWLDSVHVAWEDNDDASRLASGMLLRGRYKNKQYCRGEPVVKVTVNKAHCNRRGLAWSLVVMACIPILDILDLERSMPASIQEIRHFLGIEAAHQAILKRISLALKTIGNPVNDSHLKLVADTMVHSGDVIGFTAGGLKEFSQHISMSAPFLQGSFQAPFKTFLNAAGRGAHDDLHGIVPSSVWGKPLAVGTGAHFDLLWRSEKSGDHVRGYTDKLLDIHELVACFKSEMEEPKKLSMDQDFMPEVFEHEYMDEQTQHMERFSPPPGVIPEFNMTNDTVFGDGWGAPASFGENKEVSGLMRNDWGPPATPGANEKVSGLMANDTVSCDGWGSSATAGAKKEVSPLMTNDRVSGWGAPELSGLVTNEIVSGNGWGAPGVSGLVTKDRVSSDGWGAPEVSGAMANDTASGDGWGAAEVSGVMANDTAFGGGWGVPASFGLNKQESGLISSSSNQSDQDNLVQDWLTCVQESRIDTNQDVPNERNIFKRSSWKVSEPSSGEDLLPLNGVSNTLPTDDCHQDVEEKRNKKVFTPTGANLVPLRPRTRPRKENFVAAAGTAGLSDNPRVVDAFVKTVQNILHYRYEPGQSLLEEDMKLVMEHLLPHHPAYQDKLGCGADTIKVDFNPSYPSSRCFFVVRKDGTTADFSYHKCVMGYLEKNLPSYLEFYGTLHGSQKTEDVS